MLEKKKKKTFSAKSSVKTWNRKWDPDIQIDKSTTHRTKKPTYSNDKPIANLKRGEKNNQIRKWATQYSMKISIFTSLAQFVPRLKEAGGVFSYLQQNKFENTREVRILLPTFTFLVENMQDFGFYKNYKTIFSLNRQVRQGVHKNFRFYTKFTK